jgi:hypothetical protein
MPAMRLLADRAGVDSGGIKPPRRYFAEKLNEKGPPTETTLLIANRRRLRKFEFLEHNDDNSLAFVAQEKSRFGLDRCGSHLAAVAVLKSGPHRRTKPHGSKTD